MPASDREGGARWSVWLRCGGGSSAGSSARDDARTGWRGGRCKDGHVTSPEFSQIHVSELPPSAVLLDVREDDEWQAGHAPGAVHIPMTTLADRLDEIPEADPLYVICRSGGRSARVAQYLNANGWEAVNVDGGMSAWAALGKPLEASGTATPEVI